MAIIELQPTLEHFAQEYLLVPAWKKSHDYIRYHNWYSDVLELDLTNADLPNRIASLSDECRDDAPLRSEPLRLVLAPKSQSWDVEDGKWSPTEGISSVQRRLRPLAHVSVRDQIIATAFMMLFADIIETRQGDPRLPLAEARSRHVVSYGNRLFCDRKEGEGVLRFRWGNSSVYRQYFQDYQAFVARPRLVVEEEFSEKNDWAIVHMDLSQFYDRVRPKALFETLKSLLGDQADKRLLRKFRQFFSWRWHRSDISEIQKYGAHADPPIEAFEQVALPQGLVASGFFANAFLIPFDEAVVRHLRRWHGEREWQMIDYCRYVDDLRFVVRLSRSMTRKPEDEIAQSITRTVSDILTQSAPGLVINHDKSSVVLGRDSGGGLIPISRTLQRINHNVSGTMDIITGLETMDLIEGVLAGQEHTELGLGTEHSKTFFAAKPDVRDETVARFSANRFRRTYRSLRPLCTDDDDPTDGSLLPTLSRISLDGRAALFSRRLIERWVRDPSNVRLLRIALDLFPDVGYLKVVLGLLNQYVPVTEQRISRRRMAPRRVAWYCLAELLKAGATETGLVNDSDCLPDDVELTKYRRQLLKVAENIAQQPADSIPWYLQQQAYLYLACMRKPRTENVHPSTPEYLRDYKRLHALMRGRSQALRDAPSGIVPLALINAHHNGVDSASKTFLPRLRQVDAPTQRQWLLDVLRESPELAESLYAGMSDGEQETYHQLFLAHGVVTSQQSENEDGTSSSLLALARSSANPFQQEYAVLRFAMKALDALQHFEGAISPYRIHIESEHWHNLQDRAFPFPDDCFQVRFELSGEPDSRYELPDWVPINRRWAYQLGQMLRMILTGTPDFTERSTWKRREQQSPQYRPYRSSWLRRRYGLFNGRSAFGPPWMPITPWLAELIGRLLEWPGTARSNTEIRLPDGFSKTAIARLIRRRIRELEDLYGRASRTPVLPIRLKKPQQEGATRKVRMGVVQTVLPRYSQLLDDPELNSATVRSSHRRHLSAVLGGVHRMLQVRETHVEEQPGLELLVLPELAVHVDDVDTHLLPFALQHQCIVFAGLVFHRRLVNYGDVVNSGLWIVPSRTRLGTLQVDFFEQGKWHLTNDEEKCHISPFRPAQWVLQFTSSAGQPRCLWSMTGAMCYDSTDIHLAADLREVTDMFVVPALNRDVGTFDNMAAAMHYHMFQHVIIANSGEYGGSTGQAPFEDRHRRPIFHSHGNEQVSISFFEIDFDDYKQGARGMKTPPAGYQGRGT